MTIDYFQLFLFLGLVALTRAAVQTVPLAKLEEFDAVPQYSFSYNVQDAVTGDSKAQYETRNGDIVQGSYSLIEADGTRRIVEYTADPINGFNAVVSREPAIAPIATVTTPLVQFRPALTPIAAPAPVAPLPSIPATGPDSDVEVIETRSGPLTASSATREQEFQRQQQRQQSLRLQEQQRQSSRLQAQSRQQQSQVQVQELQQQQQQQQQQQAVAPVRAIGGQIQPVIPAASGRLINYPAIARVVATYPYATYTAAYSSPFAYAASPVTTVA